MPSSASPPSPPYPPLLLSPHVSPRVPLLLRACGCAADFFSRLLSSSSSHLSPVLSSICVFSCALVVWLRVMRLAGLFCLCSSLSPPGRGRLLFALAGKIFVSGSFSIIWVCSLLRTCVASLAYLDESSCTATCYLLHPSCPYLSCRTSTAVVLAGALRMAWQHAHVALV